MYCNWCDQQEAWATCKLCAFICSGHRDVAELLLENVANRDCRTKTGITPLFQVSQNSSTCPWCKILVREGCACGSRTEIKQPGRKEYVSFNFFLFPQACRENHVDVVELLLDYGASVNAPFPNSRLVKEHSWICFYLKSLVECKLSIPGLSSGQALCWAFGKYVILPIAPWHRNQGKMLALSDIANM